MLSLSLVKTMHSTHLLHILLFPLTLRVCHAVQTLASTSQFVCNFYCVNIISFRLNDPADNFKEIYSTINPIDKCKYAGGFYKPLVTNEIIGVLRRGLCKRVTNIVPLFVDERDSRRCQTIKLGIVLNPDEAFRVIEKGPLANTPQALEFREFWGNLSECRR